MLQVCAANSHAQSQGDQCHRKASDPGCNATRSACSSKLELVHILRRDDLCWAKDDLASGADLVFSQSACRKRLTHSAIDLALRQRLCRVIGQVAEIANVPSNILRLTSDDVFLDERGGR